MPERIPQSVAKLVVFRAISSADHASPITSRAIAITISKNGGGFGNPNAGATNATEISGGWYKFTLAVADVDTLGPLAWRGAGTGMDDAGDTFTVEAAPGAAGGPLVVGTNAATTFQGTNASGATPGTPGLSCIGGAASTTAGGAAAPGLKTLGGAGAASVNGAGHGTHFLGGGTNTVFANSHGFLVQGVSNGSGISAISAANFAIRCTPGTGFNAISGSIQGNLTGSVGAIAMGPDVYHAQVGSVGTHGARTIEWGPLTWGQDDYAKGMTVRCVSGIGVGQVRTIVGYDDATGSMAIDRDWDVIPSDVPLFDIIWGNNPRLDSLQGVTLAEAHDVFHADIQLTVDGANSRDEYTIVWMKNGVMITSGITSPTIQVVNRESEEDLIEPTEPTQIGSTGVYKHNATLANRITAGEAVLVVVTATIDGSPRSFPKLIGRDSE